MSEKPLTLAQMDMLMQLPDEDLHDVYYAEGEPADEFHYPLSHDEVLTVPISNDEVVAKLKLARLVTSRGSKAIGKVYYTARYWCQRISN